MVGHRGWRVALAMACVVVLAATSNAQPCGTRKKHPKRWAHVVWIWFENHGYDDIIGSSAAPFLNQLAGECGLATNFHNITHFSLPNYLGAVSGLALADLQPFLLDCNPGGSCLLPGDTIFAQVKSWKAYEESMPANCTLSGTSPYGVRHNPPAYVSSLASDCAVSDVPYTELQQDLDADRLPAFTFVTPNNIDNMHDGVGDAAVATGDAWLAAELPKLLASKAYRKGRTVIFVTFDEGEFGSQFAPGEDCAQNTTDPSCHIPTIVVSPSTRPGTRADALYNHYALLRTTEQLLGVRAKRFLGLAKEASSMRKDFGL